VTRVDQGQPIPPNPDWPSTLARQTIGFFRRRDFPGSHDPMEWSPWESSRSALREGTFKVAEAVADNPGRISIVAVETRSPRCVRLELPNKITHISTGGGASLDSWKAKKLPGVERSPTSVRRGVHR